MRKVLILTILTFGAIVTAHAQCGDNGQFLRLGRSGDILCTGKTGAAGYLAPFAAVSTVTVAASTHGQGVTPVGFCYDNGTPALAIALTATYPQVAANGDITFAWSGTKTGNCLVSALGSTKGDTGAPGATGTNGQSVVTATEAPGVNCATGGTKFTSISGVSYVCNGAVGPAGADSFATAAVGKADGMYCVSVVSGVPTLTQVGCPGSGGLSWTTLTNPQWTGMSNTQWTTLSN